MYEIKFIDDETIQYTSESSLLIYFDCNCTVEPSILEVIIPNQYTATNITELSNNTAIFDCGRLTFLAATELI